MRNFYDSTDKPRAFRDTFLSLWMNRELIRLLVQRDLSVRYKRSVLGLLWTLINPLLVSLVLWFVFIAIFSARLPDGTEFAPYVLSGILLITFFIQGFNQAADSISQGAGILMKVYVPPQVFAFAGAVSNAINFCFGLVALALICVITGNGIALLFPLTFLVILCMLMLITGLGLVVSVAYIRFDDTRSIFAVIVSLMMYLVPIFYPREILSEVVQRIVNANPLTSYLDVFRFVFTNTGVATTADWLYMFTSAVFFLVIGIKFFAKTWPKTVVML